MAYVRERATKFLHPGRAVQARRSSHGVSAYDYHVNLNLRCLCYADIFGTVERLGTSRSSRLRFHRRAIPWSPADVDPFVTFIFRHRPLGAPFHVSPPVDAFSLIVSYVRSSSLPKINRRHSTKPETNPTSAPQAHTTADSTVTIIPSSTKTCRLRSLSTSG